MIVSSPINDRYFHEYFSQPIVSKPEISSCSVTNFADMSNMCLSVRSAVFTMEFWLFWKILSQEYRWFHCYRHKHSPSHGMFFFISCNIGEIIFCLFRTQSLTRFTNDLDSTDNAKSVSSFPMTKFWGLATSWELILSSRPHLSRSVSPFLTDCASPSRRISSWSGRTFLTFLQEVLSGCPDRSYVVVSVFHSWEDQARSSSNFE